ncbi:MAG: 23S rRNA (cytidine(2498)-2'-O)-methyltransferase RlmM [Magnetococcus sp. YQC-5]
MDLFAGRSILLVAMDPCNQLFLYCRAGFEQECLTECAALAKAAGLPGAGSATMQSGHVLFQPDAPGMAAQLAQRLSVREMTFARHLLAVENHDQPLTPGNRIEQLLKRFTPMAVAHKSFSSLWLGAPDSDIGKALAPLCRSLQGRLESAMQQRGWLAPDPNPKQARAEIVFLTGTTALVGISWPNNSSPWPMGIPRLRLPAGSPSRAALKLEEALIFMFTPEERKKLLAPGKTVVDLGAAPGGWSFIMLRDGLTVTAVDRANLAAEVAASPRLRHLREDGFRYRPSRPVDWLLCDMVEQPRRIADLVSLWAAEGWCRSVLFNLKLPMKKRHEELQLCRERMVAPLQKVGIRYQLRLRQLYHDREEVTGLLRLPDNPTRKQRL